MGDRIALLDNGVLQQLATPAELVENPANQFVDSFLGQHRFQLALLTRTVQSIVSEAVHRQSPEGATETAGDDQKLSTRASLTDALDLFKRSGRRQVSVYDRDRYVGQLRKQDLTAAIGRVIG